jgi:peptidoglycan LD-endopeptidase LytH
VVVRLICLFMLAPILFACGTQRPVGSTTAPTSLPSLAAATLSPLATRAAVPLLTAAPTALPTVPATAIHRPATPTAIATTTPMPVATLPVQAHHVFPVQSDGEISYGRFHHDYPAADIFCPIGSVFVAVTAGVVDSVSGEDIWDPKVNDGATRGGLAVAIVGDDGVRYYGSHLSQVADGIVPGARVVAGQQLGLTGKSGDARFTDPHLHFGISRPTTPDDWEVRRGEIAPYDYLRAWQRQEDVTPDLTR